jgi:transposase
MGPDPFRMQQEAPMTMHPQAIYLIPAETERVARAAFPKGSLIMRICDEIGMLMTDRELAQLFPNVGQEALSPSRLLMVTVFQFIEGLTDRQAADAVRRCIDWKYALALELTDPGFDASVLNEFRDRLLAAEQGVRLLDHFLATCRERGLVKARGKQRTDATHVLAAIRTLNRLECLGETLATTLQHLLWDAPEWARATIPPDWWLRYEQRFDQFRLPQTAPKREALALALGADGRQLLTWIAADPTPALVQQHPAVRVLRQVWLQQFYADETPLRLRTDKDLPPAARLIGSPYDPEARLSTKRDTTWNGYKVHLTETCDPDGPNLLTDVQTTPATTPDVLVMPTVQAALASRDLLPAEHLVDTAYPDADILVQSQAQGVDLVAPVQRDSSWQAQAGEGFDLSAFQIDWEQQQVRCPQGQTSRVWSPSHDTGGKAVIHIQFDRVSCGACDARPACTRAAAGPRTLKLRPQAQHEALQTARARQETKAFKQRYKRRAGIEGTISQGVHGFDLRYARYRGLAKTALQHIFVALAINLTRLIAWWDERPKAQTRPSRFAAALQHAGMTPLPVT